MTRWNPATQPALVAAIILPRSILAERVFEVELDDLFVLFRYVIGLGVVIFGIFFLLYKDYAKKVFLKKYKNGERNTGLVVSCDEVTSRLGGRTFHVQVVYSASLPKTALLQRRFRSIKDPATVPTDSLLIQEYMYKYESNWLTPQGSIVDLFFIPGQPRSAITKEILENEQHSFSWTNTLTVLGPGTGLVMILVIAILDVLDEFPPGRTTWVGWALFLGSLALVFFVSWTCVDNRFQDYVRTTFLSSFPVQRRDSNGNIVPPPPRPLQLSPPSDSSTAEGSAVSFLQTSPSEETLTSTTIMNTLKTATSSGTTGVQRGREPSGAYIQVEIV